MRRPQLLRKRPVAGRRVYDGDEGAGDIGLWQGSYDVIDWRKYLESNPQICGSQLCARGTRIPVTVILDSIAEGASREEIRKSYPSLASEHIEAALAYAAELARAESLLPLSSP